MSNLRRIEYVSEKEKKKFRWSETETSRDLPEPYRSANVKCSRPWLRNPVGTKVSDTIISKDARDGHTPVPCGQCLACRVNKSRIWCNRIMLESRCHEANCFVTLTYDETHVLRDLVPRDITLFLKRLRKSLNVSFRYYIVGEYGDTTFRPHYHAILFGVGPEYEADILKAWGLGFIQVGDVSVQSARYVTGYVVKKMTKLGDPRLEGRVPEFARMSRMHPGGIGAGCIDMMVGKLEDSKWAPDVVREVNVGRRKMPLGRYLTERLAKRRGKLSELQCDSYDFVGEVIKTHLNHGIYRDNIVDSTSAERRTHTERHRFFSKRSKL